MDCPNCGVRTQTGSQFCSDCGAALPKTCSDCGFSNNACAKFCGGCGKSLIIAGYGPDTAPATHRDEAVPERRQVTVMFCDLADSTTLATSFDPEDLRVIVRAFQAAAKAVISQHGGFISAFLGDGVLVLFGYPEAHEDDPGQAVLAGLEVASVVRALRLEQPVGLEVRIGIATGLAVVGDLIGEGAAREEAVVGRTPNLAARLQSLAQPGEVIISDTTRRLAGTLFNYETLGLQSLKGFGEPVPAWRAVGERPVESRFEATHVATELSPLVGREKEFEVLLDKWNLAYAGAGQVVTLKGEPGIGKSRLSQALQERAATEPHMLLRYFCAPRFQNTALFPVIRQFEHAAQFADGDSPSVRLDKLEKLLLRSFAPEELSTIVPHIADLLSIPFGDRYATILETPQRRKEGTLKVLTAHIAGLTRHTPVVMIWEDLQWIDPTSLDLIEQLIAAIPSMPVFLFTTSRPEFEPPWATLPHAMILELNRLDREKAASIVEHVTGGKRLPLQILDQILEKSDGIPLFIEELTKTVLEAGFLEEQADCYTLTRPLPALAVPSTLHDSLMARLDRLAVGKEVAQIGAAIGRDFSYDLLAAVQPLAEHELHTTLARLTEADLVHCRGTPPKAIYSFKHALIQDAAYATMLRDRRQSLHTRIADVIETQFFYMAETMPELLAHHLTAANIPLKAIPYWQQAGLRAGGRAAYAEASRHFAAALDLVPRLLEDGTRTQLELSLRIQLGLSLSASRGYAAPEVEDAYKRSRELCSLLGDTAELYPVLRGLCTFYIVRDELLTAQELAEHCLRLGQETQRVDYLIEGYTALGYTLVYMGELQSGSTMLTEAVQIYRSQDGRRLTYPTSQDPAVACLCLLAHATWMLGDPCKAFQYSEEAIETAEELKRPFDLAYAHCFVAMFDNIRREPRSAARHAGITIEISQRHGFEVWLGAGTLQLAIAKGALGEATKAIALMTTTLAAWHAGGAELSRPFFLAGLAESYQAAGMVDKALTTIEEAIEHAARHREHLYDAMLYRIRGKLLALLGGTAAEKAENELRHAVEIAQRQGARLLELRAAISLHTLCLASGRPEHSRPALEKACQSLEQDGVETTDLQEARGLLTAPVSAPSP